MGEERARLSAGSGLLADTIDFDRFGSSLKAGSYLAASPAGLLLTIGRR